MNNDNLKLFEEQDKKFRSMEYPHGWDKKFYVLMDFFNLQSERTITIPIFKSTPNGIIKIEAQTVIPSHSGIHPQIVHVYKSELLNLLKQIGLKYYIKKPDYWIPWFKLI